MAKAQIPTEGRLPPAGQPSAFDAKKHLERNLPRQTGDVLKVVQIPGSNSFRVNWYDAKLAHTTAIPGLSIAYIRESKFLSCFLDAQGNPEITYPAKQ